jgi:hypothetical protein
MFVHLLGFSGWLVVVEHAISVVCNRTDILLLRLGVQRGCAVII